MINIVVGVIRDVVGLFTFRLTPRCNSFSFRKWWLNVPFLAEVAFEILEFTASCWVLSTTPVAFSLPRPSVQGAFFVNQQASVSPQSRGVVFPQDVLPSCVPGVA